MTKKDEYGFNNDLKPKDISYTNKLNPNKNKIKTIIYSNKQGKYILILFSNIFMINI